MKKMLFLIVFVCNAAFGVISSPVSNKEEIYVKQTSGNTLAAGQVVVWDLTADDELTVTTAASAVQIPTCILSEQVATGAKGKCIVRGKSSVVKFDAQNVNAVTAGSPLFLSQNEAGSVEARHEAGTDPRDGAIGIAYDSTAGSGSTLEMMIFGL